MKRLLFLLPFFVALASCKKKMETTTGEVTTTSAASSVPACPNCQFPDTAWQNTSGGPNLVFKFKLDSTQARLNNLGVPVALAAGNGGQCPRFNGISAHYIELAQNDVTPLGNGVVLYKAEETECGGSRAIVFCKSVVCKDGEVFFSVPLNKVSPGNYKWLRVSLAYQNYDVRVKTVSAGIIDGTLASFVGFNTHVSKYKMKDIVMTPTLNASVNKPQGYWGFYANVFGIAVKTEGQAAQTTVVNPNPSSPIPAGSCVVTGELYNSAVSNPQPLQITGSETQDIIITVSLSTNKSFEWKEKTVDGYFQPEIGETVVDMGLRGMVAKY